MKTLNKCFAILLCLLVLAGLCAPAAQAATEEKTIIRIYTADDLIEFARQCTLDSWSQNKTVLLQKNIDLSLTEFTPIPTFGGTFDGQGHTISGLNLRADGEVRGLFRYIQPSGLVRNLTVAGTILPASFKDQLGGIAGSNGGTILNCMFRGKIYGENTLGGIAGTNEASGRIISCSFTGSITGEHYVGGIAGQNLGSIVRCRNNGSINTTEVTPALDLSDTDLSNLNNAETAPAVTDIGGIAGFSSGVIQSCRNLGDVGYPHIGYNVGGIVGRQTGYLDSCVNSGLVQGRKDVGGIAGQMEPQLILKYDQTALDKLWGELDTLESMVDTFLADTAGASTHLTDKVQGISDSAATVKNAAADLSAAFTGWADGSIDRINDASARIVWTLERIVPVADTIEQAAGKMEHASDLLSSGLSEAGSALETGSEAAAEMSDASADMQTATIFIWKMLGELQDAMALLNQALGDSAVTEQAVNNMADAISALTDALASITVNLKLLQTAVDDLYQWTQDSPSLTLLRSGVSTLSECIDNSYLALNSITNALQSEDPFGEALMLGLEQLGTQLVNANQALLDINSGLNSLGPELRQGVQTIRSAADAITDNLVLAGTASKKLSDGLNLLVENVDIQALEKVLSTLTNSMTTVQGSVLALGLAMGHLEQGMALLSDTALELSGALDTFSQAGSAVADSIGLLEDAMADAKTLISELSEMPAIQFELLGETVADEGEALSAAADVFLESFNDLNAALRAEANALTDDLRDINAQVGAIVDLLHQFLIEEQEKESGDLLNDVSDQDCEDNRSAGKISACENLGTVNGDRNAAGIVGSLSIEYDFDPEDDLVISGSRNLEFSFLARAVVYHCINRGDVTAKKDCAGGIVGSMDLGRIAACQGYGSVTSTGGGYVGGIVGESYGSIVNCWAKCSLSGSDRVGGIAGLGSMIENCRSLVAPDNCEIPFVGAIAGQVCEGAELSGNFFVHHILAGIDGVSYKGQAEPLSYDEFCAMEDVPAEFSQFELTFTAGETTVAVIPFRYGDSLSALPDIPEKAGHSAQWPEFDLSFLSFSRTLDAQYMAYDTVLTDGQPVPGVLVSGSFSPGAQMAVTEAPASWLGADGVLYEGTAFTVTVTDPAVEDISYTLHWRLPEDGSYTLWIFGETGWTQQDYTPDGSYLLLHCTGESVTFCFIEEEPFPVMFLALAAASLLLLILIVVIIVRSVKRHKKTAAVSESKH